MKIQVDLDLIEVPRDELWEFAETVPQNARIDLQCTFADEHPISDWEFQEFELLAQWSDAPHLVSKSATIDLTNGSNLMEAIRALVDTASEDAIFEPIVAAYDHRVRIPLERISPVRCNLVASWEQDPTVPILEG